MEKLKQMLHQMQTQPGIKGWCRRKLLGRLYEWLTELLQALEQCQQTAVQYQAENRRLETQLAAEQKAREQAEQRLAQLRQDFEAACVNLRDNNTALERDRSDLALLKVQLRQMQRQANSTGSCAAEELSAVEMVPAAASAEKPEQTYQAIEYFDFENHFRGSVAHIKQTQQIYLPYFADKQHVLDIGCGRGEFLSLLHDHGIPAKGVDLYAPYVDFCQSQGLSAVCGDGLAYLAQLETVDGIFLGQVVEHLTPEQIAWLCETAYEKLSPGGCLVAETPNPTSLSIYTNAFYIDPSHVKPVHPLTMQYYLEKAGFQQVTLLYPESSKPDKTIPPLQCAGENVAEFNEAMQQVAQMLYGSQDYAVIAVKS